MKSVRVETSVKRVGGMRSFLFVIQYFFYLSYNLLLIFYYLFIGESDYVEPHSAKTFGSAEVFFLLVWLGMIATINLYYQLPFKANKINNKPPMICCRRK